MLEKYGIRVWNIGLDSKLEVFLKANLTDIFPTLLKIYLKYPPRLVKI